MRRVLHHIREEAQNELLEEHGEQAIPGTSNAAAALPAASNYVVGATGAQVGDRQSKS